ncbi:hypothetical protein AYX13_06756 [Cryptococcus neoformans]|nr:hypothetical protein AYX13_06756 [Cryptococcus neoformans var. grubii]
MADSTLPSASSSTAIFQSEPPKKATRSRNGCLVCRSRRLKCDLEKPECRRCVNYGAECVYPAKKPFNAEAVDEKLRKRHKRSKSPASPSHSDITPDAFVSIPPIPMARPIQSHEPMLNGFASSQTTPLTATTPISSYPTPFPLPASHPHLPPNSTPAYSPITVPTGRTPLAQVKAMEPMELLMALCRDTRMGQFFSGPVDPPDFLRDAFPVEEELRCFHHCFTYTLSTMVVQEEFNPWVEQVVPLFLFPTGDAPLSIAALRFGTLATGAVHLSSLEEKGSAPNTYGQTRGLGLRYRDEAVRYLRAAQNVPEEMASDVFLSACMMVSHADLLGANHCWREVLRLAHASVRFRGGCERVLFGNSRDADPSSDGDGRQPTPLRVCLIEHLVLVDIFASMTTGQRCVVLTESSYWWEKLRKNDFSLPDTVERSSGIHRSIFPLIVQANNLLWEYSNLSKCISPPSPSVYLSSLSPIPDLTGRALQLSAELSQWREAVFPTIKDQRSRAGSLALWHGLQIMVKRELMRKDRGDEGVQMHAVEILEICEEVGVKVEYMNWPLLISCSVLLSPPHRQRAREILKSFIYQCSYEVAMVESVAEECWRRTDDGVDDEGSSWREVLIEMGCAVLLG